MRIGILTHYWMPNFGANLQALATAKSLEAAGHDPVFLNYRVRAIEELYKHRTSDAQLDAHDRFCCQHLYQSSLFCEGDDVIEVAKHEKLVAVVSGSDAVLRLDASGEREDLTFPNPFWLGWARKAGLERTGFLAASSMGSNFLELGGTSRKAMRKSVLDLNHCSVRDRWTEIMLRACGVPRSFIKYCPDPVSIFSSDPLGDGTEALRLPDQPYILLGLYAHSFCQGWRDEFRKIANDAGYITVGLPQPDIPAATEFDIELKLPLDPLDWMRWIRGCSGYVGVRFHPIMLCQTFGLPFLALDYYDLGIPFSNRGLRKAGRLLAPVFRNVSKTFDVCARAGKERYVVPGRSLSRIRPRTVFDLLEEQRSAGQSHKIAEERKNLFLNSLHSIICDRDEVEQDHFGAFTEG